MDINIWNRERLYKHFLTLTYRNQDYKDCFDSHRLFQTNQKVGDKPVKILKYLVYVCKTDRSYVTHWFLKSQQKHYSNYQLRTKKLLYLDVSVSYQAAAIQR